MCPLDMRKLLYLGAILITLTACNNESATPICGDIEGEGSSWVQTQIEDLQQTGDQYSYIVQAEYNGELVYSVQGCNPAALYALLYFRCNGEQISNAELDEFTNQQIIWRPEGSRCRL